jgi:hypothetical protein
LKVILTLNQYFILQILPVMKAINLSIILFAIFCQCANNSKEMEQSEKTLVLQGIFDSAGNKLVKIDKPTLYNRKLSRPTPDKQEGRYMVLIHYHSADSLKVFFDALVSGDRKEDHAVYGFFEIQVPVKNKNIESVKIMETKTRKRFAEFSAIDIIQN